MVWTTVPPACASWEKGPKLPVGRTGRHVGQCSLSENVSWARTRTDSRQTRQGSSVLTGIKTRMANKEFPDLRDSAAWEGSDQCSQGSFSVSA